MKVLADTVDIVIGIDPHKHTHTAAIVAAAWRTSRGITRLDHTGIVVMRLFLPELGGLGAQG